MKTTIFSSPVPIVLLLLSFVSLKLSRFKQTTAIGLAILSISTLSSCTHYYYMPSIQNVPLFKEKNEFRLMAAKSTGEYISATEVQTAFSITEKFAVMGNLMYAERNKSNLNSFNQGNNGNGTYGEGAFGYYKPLDNTMVFEVYGGLGFANQHHSYSYFALFQPNQTATADLKYMKAYIQPSIGSSLNAVDFVLSTRFGYLSYYNISNPYDLPDVQIIENNNKLFLFEPALTLRVGWKQVKIHVQGGLQVNTLDSRIPMEHFSISAGIYFALANRFLPPKKQ